MANDFYYSAKPQSEHEVRQIAFSYRGKSLRFETDSSVFSKTQLDRGTEILLRTLPDELSGRVLDMGCGWGAIGVSLGAVYPACEITMCDINERACGLSEKNARANGVRAQVLISDGWEKVRGHQYDYIVQNPPIRAGKAVLYQMFADAAQGLGQGGEYWLVIRKQQGAPSALTHLKTLFRQALVVEREAGYWISAARNPIQSAEASWSFSAAVANASRLLS